MNQYDENIEISNEECSIPWQICARPSSSTGPMSKSNLQKAQVYTNCGRWYGAPLRCKGARAQTIESMASIRRESKSKKS
eukprot:402794-Amphidinium_carterae.1